ncbi:hypothetical protein NHQ30_006629 [Ciborinia camelliae]|nr:hypothetical protein NHQ30_006629 [Ciborinia camelliae]
MKRTLSKQTTWAKRRRQALSSQEGKTFVKSDTGMETSTSLPDALQTQMNHTLSTAAGARQKRAKNEVKGAVMQAEDAAAIENFTMTVKLFEKNPKLDDKSKAMDLILGWLALVRSGLYLTSPGPEVKAILDEGTDLDLATRIIDGWSGKTIDMILYGEGWQDIGAELLPHVPSTGDEKGLYINFLTVVALRGRSKHMKVYGGMAAGVRGLRDRINTHRNKSLHLNNPSYHYMIMDLPGTLSDFRQFAGYGPGPLGFFLLAEGCMIAVGSL